MAKTFNSGFSGVHKLPSIQAPVGGGRKVTPKRKLTPHEKPKYAHRLTAVDHDDY